jgi:hypothetical protein
MSGGFVDTAFKTVQFPTLDGSMVTVFPHGSDHPAGPALCLYNALALRGALGPNATPSKATLTGVYDGIFLRAAASSQVDLVSVFRAAGVANPTRAAALDFISSDVAAELSSVLRASQLAPAAAADHFADGPGGRDTGAAAVARALRVPFVHVYGTYGTPGGLECAWTALGSAPFGVMYLPAAQASTARGVLLVRRGAAAADTIERLEFQAGGAASWRPLGVRASWLPSLDRVKAKVAQQQQQRPGFQHQTAMAADAQMLQGGAYSQRRESVAFGFGGKPLVSSASASTSGSKQDEVREVGYEAYTDRGAGNRGANTARPGPTGNRSFVDDCCTAFSDAFCLMQ